MVNINSVERDGLRQAEFCPRNTMMMNTNNTFIPDRSQPGIIMTAPTVRHRDVGDKYATGVPKIKKIRGRENISVGTWNVRILNSAGKLEHLTHAMGMFHWKIEGSARCAGIALVRCQRMTDTRFISVEKRTDMSMGLDFLCTRKYWMLSLDAG